MNPIVYAIPVFMLTVAAEALIAWRQKRAVYDIPDALTSLHAGVLSRLAEAFFRTLTFALYLFVWDNYRATELSPANPLVWVFALLAYDLAYYWTHRLGHEMNVMWASHVVHHSSEYFNLSTALRQSSTGVILHWAILLLLAVAGVPPQVYGVVALIDLLYQYWVHTELIGKLGWLDRIMVTPSNHRVHHGQNDYCIDRNYGGIFIIWDRIFGTFVEERDHEKIVYGIRRPLQSYNALWANVHIYADLLRQSLAAPGVRAKLAVWLAPPSGWRGENLAPLAPATFKRFATGTPPGLRWYCAAQYAASVPFITHFVAVAPQLDMGARGLYALGILATAMILGALLEGREKAPVLELLRLSTLGVAFAALPLWFGFAAPFALKAAVVLGVGASALWLVLARPLRARKESRSETGPALTQP